MTDPTDRIKPGATVKARKCFTGVGSEESERIGVVETTDTLDVVFRTNAGAVLIANRGNCTVLTDAPEPEPADPTPDPADPQPVTDHYHCGDLADDEWEVQMVPSGHWVRPSAYPPASVCRARRKQAPGEALLSETALIQTTDARVWAEQFVARFGGDVGLMIGWFANAIEAGEGVGRAINIDPEPEQAPPLTPREGDTVRSSFGSEGQVEVVHGDFACCIGEHGLFMRPLRDLTVTDRPPKRPVRVWLTDEELRAAASCGSVHTGMPFFTACRALVDGEG